jgi:cell division protein ZapA
MANVNIKFNNKDYLLSCDDGQEENLKELAEHLDLKYNELKNNLGNIGESKLLLITAIQMVDDYFDLNKKINSKKNDFEKLSIKFKELRSLAINYKDEKEKEIEKLKDELNKFQQMIEESKDSYEEILDKTTKSIEKFIEDAEAEKEKNIQ